MDMVEMTVLNMNVNIHFFEKFKNQKRSDNNCRVIKLTAKVKKQYISADFGRGKCFFAMKVEK